MFPLNMEWVGKEVSNEGYVFLVQVHMETS